MRPLLPGWPAHLDEVDVPLPDELVPLPDPVPDELPVPPLLAPPEPALMVLVVLPVEPPVVVEPDRELPEDEEPLPDELPLSLPVCELVPLDDDAEPLLVVVLPGVEESEPITVDSSAAAGSVTDEALPVELALDAGIVDEADVEEDALVQAGRCFARPGVAWGAATSFDCASADAPAAVAAASCELAARGEAIAACVESEPAPWTLAAGGR